MAASAVAGSAVAGSAVAASAVAAAVVCQRDRRNHAAAMLYVAAACQAATPPHPAKVKS